MISCIAGTAYAALRKLAPNGEDTLVIFGQGPVGLMATIMAKAMGARVIAVDPVADRLELARRFQADEVVNPLTGDWVEAVRDLSGGMGARLALETSGHASAHQGVIDVLRPNGQGAFVGFGASEPTVNLSQIISKQLVLMGSFVMPVHYYEDLVDFILRHDLSPQFQALITHRFPLTAAAEAFGVADAGRAGKVLFVWE